MAVNPDQDQRGSWRQNPDGTFTLTELDGSSFQAVPRRPDDDWGDLDDDGVPEPHDDLCQCVGCDAGRRRQYRHLQSQLQVIRDLKIDLASIPAPVDRKESELVEALVVLSCRIEALEAK